MTIYKIILMLNICFSVAGNFMLKYAMKRIGVVEINKEIFYKLNLLIRNPIIWIAVLISSLSFLTYAIVLSKMELNRALPISIFSVTILIFIISVVFFNESIGFLKILGIILCLAGIFLIFRY